MTVQNQAAQDPEHGDVWTRTAEHDGVLTWTVQHDDVVTLIAGHDDVLTGTAQHDDVLTVYAQLLIKICLTLPYGGGGGGPRSWPWTCGVIRAADKPASMQ